MFKNKKTKYLEYLKSNFGQIKSELFDFDSIKTYFTHKTTKHSIQKINDKTCQDLDFEEFFMYIDRTNSVVGQQFLYNKVRNIPATDSQLDLKENIIDLISSNESFRLETQWNLSKLNDSNAYYIPKLFQSFSQKPSKWDGWMRGLSVLSFISICLLFWFPVAFFLVLTIFTIHVGFHYWNKKKLNPYLVSLPQLYILKTIAQTLSLHPEFIKLQPDIKSDILKLNPICRIISFFNFDLKFAGDLGALIHWFLELIKILFLLEPILLQKALSQIEKHQNEIENIFNFIGEIDSLNSIASLRHGSTYYCKPYIVSTKTLEVSDMYHPLIANCVSNSVTLSNQSMLLTGSNMSGKTSFIRAIGLNIISGLTLNTCFAHKMSFPRTRIYSAIRISDDLMNDKSYYFEEVLTIKELIEKSTEHHSNIFLLDELYKGTNTIERISAGKAVLSYLSKNDNIVMASTHDIELTDLLQETYSLYHFSEKIEENSINFDYKLKMGKLKTRNAIRILEINDYPKEIVSEANEIVFKIETT